MILLQLIQGGWQSQETNPDLLSSHLAPLVTNTVDGLGGALGIADRVAVCAGAGPGACFQASHHTPPGEQEVAARVALWQGLLQLGLLRRAGGLYCFSFSRGEGQAPKGEAWGVWRGAALSRASERAGQMAAHSAVCRVRQAPWLCPSARPTSPADHGR